MARGRGLCKFASIRIMFTCSFSSSMASVGKRKKRTSGIMYISEGHLSLPSHRVFREVARTRGTLYVMYGLAVRRGSGLRKYSPLSHSCVLFTSVFKQNPLDILLLHLIISSLFKHFYTHLRLSQGNESTREKRLAAQSRRALLHPSRARTARR